MLSRRSYVAACEGGQSILIATRAATQSRRDPGHAIDAVPHVVADDIDDVIKQELRGGPRIEERRHLNREDMVVVDRRRSTKREPARTGVRSSMATQPNNTVIAFK